MSSVDLPVFDADAMLAKFQEKLPYLDLSSSDDSSPPPPAYDKAVPVEPEKLKEVLESPKAQKVLGEEVEALGDTAQRIETAFRSVSRGLARTVDIAKAGKLTQRSTKLNGYKDRWDGFREKYIELVWESRRVAGSARAVALDFAGDFLDVIKDDAYTFEEKQKEITAYRKSLETDARDGAKVSQGFKELHHKVADFRKDISDDIKAWVGEEEKHLEELRLQIVQVEKDLKRAAVIAAGAAAGGAAMAIAGGITTAIGIICPVLWIGSALLFGIGGGAAAYCGYKYYVLRKKRDELRARHATLEESSNTTKKIQASINTLEGDMAFVEEKLIIFASVWAIISSDLQEVEENLKMAQDAKTKIRFKKKMDTISAAYGTLARALRLYETNVHIKQMQ